MLNFVGTDVLDAQLCGHGMQFRAILYENINCKSEPSGILYENINCKSEASGFLKKNSSAPAHHHRNLVTLLGCLLIS